MCGTLDLLDVAHNRRRMHGGNATTVRGWRDGGGTKFRRESEGLFSFLGTRSHVHCSPELKSMPSRAHSRFSRRHLWTGADQPRNAFVLRERGLRRLCSESFDLRKMCEISRIILYSYYKYRAKQLRFIIIKLIQTHSSYLR